ncbi:uncharacterized protein LOC106073032 [Biomphalaria glabrata]|uniref:Uncharacterized protein LOC106073032 n=1 Tax=Biomphalaria glabrata TaxID=6526 RepID=A0A9U8EIC8_BIOGL|nr:uncharacterized protein LOC106073032 [Biomphalaria glabrata]KAI8745097.1 hypothetical protein BgiMline_020497 [Biomphalaria glabrata]KAI8776089.1 hypothetical protein BgiBS90_023245 [Biomphalaria glabrata]
MATIDFLDFSKQVTIQISDLSKTLVSLQGVVQSLSTSQRELSTKMDNHLLMQQNSTEMNFFEKLNNDVDDQETNETEMTNEAQLLPSVMNLKRDLYRKLDLDKVSLAEVLENKIQYDIRMDGLEAQLSMLTNNLSALEKHVYRYEHFETAEKVDSLEKRFKELAQLQARDSSAVKKIYESSKGNGDFEQLKYKVDLLEQELSRNYTKIQEVKQQCCEVYQLFETRLVHFEKLKESLNQVIMESAFNKTKITELEKDIKSLKILVPKMKISTVGFTAYFNEPIKLLKQDVVLTGFKDVRVNEQDGFNPDSGYFTAPVNGVYAVSVTLCQMSTGYLEASVIHYKHSNGQETWVARIVGHREVRGNSDTSVTLVLLKKLDRLCVKVTDTGKLNCPTLTDCTSFSCFLINKL